MKSISSHHRNGGFTLVELLVVLLLLAIAALLAVPTLAEVMAQSTLRAASQDVGVLFSRARQRAATHRVDVGIRWLSTGGDLSAAVYEDGNENGIVSVEIGSGVDRLVEGPIAMRGRWPGVSFSFLPGFALPGPDGRPVGDLTDPVRFGRSNICTFSPTGKASPGTVYLSNGKNRMAAVRVTPGNGRIQVFEWSAPTGKWQRMR